MGIRHGRGKIKLKCACGHKITTNGKVLNDFKSDRYYECYKCGRRYKLFITITNINHPRWRMKP